MSYLSFIKSIINRHTTTNAYITVVIEKGVDTVAKVRQDAWSHEDDLLLAETVLRHVREGSTQLNAFEEVGDQLNRTSAACGFRWNAEVRKRYKNAMDLAKRQRKERKRAMAKNKKQKQSKKIKQTNATKKQALNVDESTMSIDTVIQFLTTLKHDYDASNQSKQMLEQTEKENEKLKEHVDELKKKLKKTEEQLHTIQEDYQTFIQIMERARKMTVFEDEETVKAPAFKMDKNGNLEQLAERMN